MPEYPGRDFQQGDTGDNVKAIQKALGLGPGGQTGVFGPYTEELVTNFQKAHDLDPDGVVGRLTWAALFKPAPAPTQDIGERAVAHAKNFLNVREKPLGSNRGPEIDAWNQAVGVARGSFWCMAFVHAMVQKACVELGLQVSDVFPKSASCSAVFRWAKERGRVVARPKKGDVFLCIGGDTGHFHTGFVASNPDGNGRFETIEGNSNEGGSANGIGVFHRSPGRSLPSCHYISL